MVTKYLAGPPERYGRSIFCRILITGWCSQKNIKDEAMMVNMLPLQELKRSWYCSLCLQTDHGLWLLEAVYKIIRIPKNHKKLIIPTFTSNKYFKWRKMQPRNACSQASYLFNPSFRKSSDENVASLRLKQQFLYSHTRTISFKNNSPAGMKKHLSKINP